MAKIAKTVKTGFRPHAANANPWIAVAIATVLLLVWNANNASFGVFFKPIIEEFGWGRGAVSLAITIRWLVVAVSVMFMGHFSDRYGPRSVVLPCFLLISAGFLLMSRVTAIWQLYLVQGLLMGVGTAGPLVCLISTVAKWHEKKRGLALGVATAGTGLAIVVFPPLAAGLISAIGWQEASVAMGLGTLVIAVTGSLFVKNPPLAKNQNALATSGEVKRDGQSKSQGPLDVIRSLPHLLRNRQFLSIFMFFLLFQAGCQLVNNHFVNYMTDAGIKTLMAATVMSVTGMAGVAGRLAMGPLSDKLGSRTDAAICCSLVATALVLLTFKVEPLMWFSAVLFGVGWGGAAPLVPAMAGDYLGQERLATMTGSVLVGVNLGGAIGPWLGGFLFDVTNSYLWALILSAVLAAVGLAIILRLDQQGEN